MSLKFLLNLKHPTHTQIWQPGKSARLSFMLMMCAIASKRETIVSGTCAALCKKGVVVVVLQAIQNVRAFTCEACSTITAPSFKRAFLAALSPSNFAFANWRFEAS